MAAFSNMLKQGPKSATRVPQMGHMGFCDALFVGKIGMPYAITYKLVMDQYVEISIHVAIHQYLSNIFLCV